MKDWLIERWLGYGLTGAGIGALSILIIMPLMIFTGGLGFILSLPWSWIISQFFHANDNNVIGVAAISMWIGLIINGFIIGIIISKIRSKK